MPPGHKNLLTSTSTSTTNMSTVDKIKEIEAEVKIINLPGDFSKLLNCILDGSYAKEQEYCVPFGNPQGKIS